MDSSPTQSTSKAVLNYSITADSISSLWTRSIFSYRHSQSHPVTCLYQDEGSALPSYLPKVHSCGSAQCDPLSITVASMVHARKDFWQPNLRSVIFSYPRNSQNRQSLDQFLFRTARNLEQFACELLAVSPEKCYLFIIYSSFQAGQFNSST